MGVGLQEKGLQLLADDRVQGLPSPAAQRSVLAHYRGEIERLKAGDVFPFFPRGHEELPRSWLIIVKNLTYGALMRAHERGYVVPPGGKVRCVVVDSLSTEPLQRIRLVEELEMSTSSSPDAVLTTVSSLSAPFGPFSPRLVGPPNKFKTTADNQVFSSSLVLMLKAKNPNR